jgi:hypothetical protein
MCVSFEDSREGIIDIALFKFTNTQHLNNTITPTLCHTHKKSVGCRTITNNKNYYYIVSNLTYHTTTTTIFESGQTTTMAYLGFYHVQVQTFVFLLQSMSFVFWPVCLG